MTYTLPALVNVDWNKQQAAYSRVKPIGKVIEMEEKNTGV